MAQLGLIQSATYVLEGLPLFVLNCIIICAVLRHPLLRERNTSLLLASIAVAEGLSCLGFAIKGAQRFMIYWSGRQGELVSAWSCFTTIPTALLAPLDVTYGLVQMSVTFDRFLSVFDPLRHGGLGRGYVYTLIVVSHAPVIPAYLYGLYAAYQTRHDATVSILCMPTQFWPEQFYSYVSMAWLMLMTLSAVLYLLIILKVTCTKNESGADQSAEERLQHQVTVSLGLSSAGTFVLCVVPILAMIAFMKMNFGHEFFSIYMPIRGVCGIASMGMNFFVFTIRHKDMRMGVKLLFSCKELTQNYIQTAQHQNAQVSHKPKAASRNALSHHHA